MISPSKFLINEQTSLLSKSQSTRVFSLYLWWFISIGSFKSSSFIRGAACFQSKGNYLLFLTLRWITVLFVGLILYQNPIYIPVVLYGQSMRQSIEMDPLILISLLSSLGTAIFF